MSKDTDTPMVSEMNQGDASASLIELNDVNDEKS